MELLLANAIFNTLRRTREYTCIFILDFTTTPISVVWYSPWKIVEMLCNNYWNIFLFISIFWLLVYQVIKIQIKERPFFLKNKRILGSQRKKGMNARQQQQQQQLCECIELDGWPSFWPYTCSTRSTASSSLVVSQTRWISSHFCNTQSQALPLFSLSVKNKTWDCDQSAASYPLSSSGPL